MLYLVTDNWDRHYVIADSIDEAIEIVRQTNEDDIALAAAEDLEVVAPPEIHSVSMIADIVLGLE